ncbi:MAG TPA: carbamoyl-phosphate synthase large subunit, partial [Tetragenococcus sp.]|nr:carbamoyl-phosphate synthase large subunit [Tetragenococcus sp.]
IADQDKFESLALARDFNDLGFSLMGTKKTAAYFKKHDLKVRVVGKVHEGHPNVLDMIRQDSIQMVINTIANDHKASSKDGFMIRRQAVEQGIVLFTSLDTAQAILRVIKSRAFTTQALS